jgi:hypothetical protein
MDVEWMLNGASIAGCFDGRTQVLARFDLLTYFMDLSDASFGLWGGLN